MLRCLIATIGKDAPGTNAAVRAATRLALRRGMEVYGAKRGLVGVLENQFHRMREADVGMVLGKGGSVLGSSDFRVEAGDADVLNRLAQTLGKFDLIVACGGLGSFALLNRVYSSHRMEPTTTMFVPASVENEFLDPRHGQEGADGVHAEAIGADTAANTAIEAIDRLREQAYLSRTVFLIECVGAKSNYLPIQIGAACGAHRIYLSRYPTLPSEARDAIRQLYGEEFDPNHVDIRELVRWIESMLEEPTRKYLVCIIPSGIPLIDVAAREARLSEENRETYEEIITSMAPLELTVFRVVDSLLMHFSEPGGIQVRHVLLDDLQRGGSPSLRDRMLGSIYGEAAVEEFLALLNFQDVEKRGNLNLLSVHDTSRVAWTCTPRQEVEELFQGSTPRAGGLDPLPFFRQMRGTISGFRPLAEQL